MIRDRREPTQLARILICNQKNSERLAKRIAVLLLHFDIGRDAVFPAILSDERCYSLVMRVRAVSL